MQRFFDIVRDQYGNCAANVSVSVYLSGTSTLATIYQQSGADTPTSVQSNPIITDSSGVVAFAVQDGDYDIYFYGTNITPFWRYRWNAFDGTTATTGSQSSFSLTVPVEFSVSGSPGTSISISKATETANYVWAGPTTGAAAAPTFRALVAADINSVAVDKSTAQTGIGGAKTWTGAATFSAGVTTTTLAASGAATLSSTLSVADDITIGTATDIKIDTATPYTPYRTIFPMFFDATPASAPTLNSSVIGTIRAPAFTDANTNEINFCIPLGSDVPQSATLYPFVTWCGSGTSTGNVRWGLEYSLAYTNAAAGLASTTTIYKETAGTGVASGATTSVFSGISATACGPMTVLVCRLFRDGSHVNDTNTDSAFLLGCGVHYATSRPFGSKNTTYPFT